MHPSSLHGYHLTALNQFMVKDSIKQCTMYQYISHFRQYFNYCITHKYHPWTYYTDIKYWCYYLLWRITHNSISVFVGDKRGISFIFNDLFGFPVIFKGKYYDSFRYKVNKMYGKDSDSRMHILLFHHIKLYGYYKLSKSNAHNINLDILCIIVAAQVMGFAGRRCGEVINVDSPLLIENISFHKTVQHNGTTKDAKYMAIIHNDYKNKKHKLDYMYSFISHTGHEVIDPYHYMRVYLKRRVSKYGPLQPSDYLFYAFGGNITRYYFMKYIINIIKEVIVDPEYGMYYKPYSFRIGLNVMLESRSMSQGQIQDYVGWSRGNSSQIIYTRMPRYWKINVINFILNTPVNMVGFNHWGFLNKDNNKNDNNNNNNKKKRKRKKKSNEALGDL